MKRNYPAQTWENAYCDAVERGAGFVPVRVGLLGQILWSCGWTGRHAGGIVALTYPENVQHETARREEWLASQA